MKKYSFRKRQERRKREQRAKETNSKTVNLNMDVSVITLNISELKVLVNTEIFKIQL